MALLSRVTIPTEISGDGVHVHAHLKDTILSIRLILSTFWFEYETTYFITYALHGTKVHTSVTFATLVLLHRVKARFPTARGSSGPQVDHWPWHVLVPRDQTWFVRISQTLGYTLHMFSNHIEARCDVHQPLPRRRSR